MYIRKRSAVWTMEPIKANSRYSLELIDHGSLISFQCVLVIFLYDVARRKYCDRRTRLFVHAHYSSVGKDMCPSMNLAKKTYPLNLEARNVFENDWRKSPCARCIRISQRVEPNTIKEGSLDISRV